MRVIQHTTSLRPHIWQQRFFWSKARFVGIIAGIRGGKTVIGSIAFLKDLTDCPSGAIEALYVDRAQRPKVGLCLVSGKSLRSPPRGTRT